MTLIFFLRRYPRRHRFAHGGRDLVITQSWLDIYGVRSPFSPSS